MKRILKIVGIATLLSALLVVSIGGIVSAANGPQVGEGPSYGDGDCTCECVCECLSDGECICGNCVLNEYSYNYSGEVGKANKNAYKNANAGKPVEAYKYKNGLDDL